jgi:AP-4 complex subunit mu-1
MKSYQKGNPELKLVLNDDIIVGRPSGYSSGSVVDDCNFHQSVNTREIESQKTLYILPPDGEFVVMNYRINTEFSAPFKIYSTIDESPYKLELKIKVNANFFDKFFAGNVVVRFNVPKTAQNVYFDIAKNKI